MDVISLNLFYKNSKQDVYTLAPKLHLSTWSRATKFMLKKAHAKPPQKILPQMRPYTHRAGLVLNHPSRVEVLNTNQS